MKFEDIIGNEPVKNYLKKCLENGNILHSYLFTGIEGIGKFKMAKEFAKYILCLDSNAENCKCKSCVCFDGNNHPDFMVINEEGETIKIEQIRELVNKIIEKPIMSERKVYIINDSEKLTKEAQNCLLKTLEEPPKFATIILVSSNENMLLNTIKSRCMQVKFSKIDDDILLKYAKENLGYDNVSPNLLKCFEGSIGKAQRTKENEDLFSEIDVLIDKMKEMDIVSLFLSAKFMYNKDKIFEILNYLTICLYEKGLKEKKYLDCINDVNTCISSLNSNANFDMSVDRLLFSLKERI